MKMNTEIMQQNLQHQVEKTLAGAKDILYKIDSEIDKFEGQEVYTAMLAVQDLLLEWNLLAHNFTTAGIYDWVSPTTPSEQ